MFIQKSIFGSKAIFIYFDFLKDPLLCVPRLLGVCLYRNDFPAVPQTITFTYYYEEVNSYFTAKKNSTELFKPITHLKIFELNDGETMYVE